MSKAQDIAAGKTHIGIEFGSTRIKAVLIGEDFAPLASGVFDWENKLENGYWTYGEQEIITGLQTCFADLMRNTEQNYGVRLTRTAGLGISAMMHGYLAFDGADRLLVPFRTWRNTTTGPAADALTEAFSFNIPQRWSIAHLYQAILNKETHVPEIRFLTTLAGYVHFLLTGKRVIGIGDASGMFPIDPETRQYDADMCSTFAALTADTVFQQHLTDILPEIIPVGSPAGTLTAEGALLLDPTGTFQAGVPLCPPEGDAQTGMTATNSVRCGTGNVSAGTSIFAMIVVDGNLSKVHREVDIVTTPDGYPTAMVHCNNCSSDLDAWVGMFGGFLKECGADLPKPKLYDLLYQLAAEGDPDCGGIVSYNYIAGEQITGLSNGVPLLMRPADAKLGIRNLMRSLVYSCFATLKLGMDILTQEEHVQISRICAHGGLFKTPTASQPFLAAALGADVVLMESAGEGGAWGIALLTAFMTRENRSLSLADYLQDCVFAGKSGQSVSPAQTDIDGLEKYMTAYRTGLAAERAAAGEA